MIPISGSFSIPERQLQYEVGDRLDLNSNKGCFTFRGENGIGKTSFVEKILIPKLNAEQTHFLYIGQDIRIQLYTLRALLGALGYRVKLADDIELLRIWISHSQSARVFILDEFDKFFPDYPFIFEWSHSFIDTYIFITHSNQNRVPPAYAEQYPTSNIRFDLLEGRGPVKHVRITRDIRSNRPAD